MGCIFSLFETDLTRDEILYIPGVDFYTEAATDEHEINELFFLYD